MSLDDDSDKSGIGSVYTLLGFHYLGNISLRHNDEDEKSGGNGSKKKAKTINDASDDDSDDSVYKPESGSRSSGESIGSINTVDTADSYIGVNIDGPEMFNTIPNFVNIIEMLLPQINDLFIEIYTKITSREISAIKLSNPVKKRARGFLQLSKKKGFFKRRQKTFKKQYTKSKRKVKSKLKREKLIGLAASHPHTLTNKRIY